MAAAATGSGLAVRDGHRHCLVAGLHMRPSLENNDPAVELGSDVLDNCAPAINNLTEKLARSDAFAIFHPGDEQAILADRLEVAVDIATADNLERRLSRFG